MRTYKRGSMLYFELDNGDTVSYDLAKKTCYGKSGKEVFGLKKQFANYDIYNIIGSCEEKWYGEFLKFCLERAQRKKNPNIGNIGTVLEYASRYSGYEQLFSAGLKVDTDFLWTFKSVPKALMKICKDYSLTLTNKLYRSYYYIADACQIATKLDFVTLTTEDYLRLLQASCYSVNHDRNEWGGYEFPYFYQLIHEYGYNAKALLLYIDRLYTFEAIYPDARVLSELLDYAKMMSTISKKYDRYPRNFLTTHRIASRNYNRMKKDFSEELFKKRIKPEMEYEIGDYVFIYPKSTQDIKDEAAQMNHCVASYIDDVIDGRTDIIFLRYKKSPDKSLVTVQVTNGKVVQARRHFNYDISDSEQDAINKWQKHYDSIKNPKQLKEVA